MLPIAILCDYLDAFAPPRLAEEWDNVGLLLGDRQRPATRVMTCLTLTPDSAAEAIAEQAELVVAHHPLPFRPLKRITTDDAPGKLVWQLARAGVAVYSPHTAFDSAAEGINQQLAAGLELVDAQPLVPSMELKTADGAALGAGRWGRIATPVSAGKLAARLCRLLRIPGVKTAGPFDRPLERVAIACGSGGSLLDAARRLGCHAFVTGEMTFHGCLEAEAEGITVLLAGHYASERLAVEWLAAHLATRFPALAIWASRTERDPISWVEAP